MTYYEELGVGAKASTEEIRKAYKRLARLLHPDKHPDKTSRNLAECQMRRLNGVCATLTDANRRREYDRSLEPPPAPAIEPAPAEPDPDSDEHNWRDWRHWLTGPNAVWAAATGIALFLLLYTLRDVGRAPAAPAVPLHEQTKAGPASNPPAQPRRPADNPDNRTIQLQQRIDALLADYAASQRRVEQLESQLRNLNRNHEVAVDAQQPSPPPSPPPPERAPPAQAAPQPPRGLTGSWFFAKPSTGRGTRETYPAEFIEASIQEDGGHLIGKYKARYRVTDRAISPDVAFQFSGPGAATSTFPWSGTGGSKGEVRLRLLTENTLEIAWVASDLGTLGLGSGTAVLIRKLEQQP